MNRAVSSTHWQNSGTPLTAVIRAGTRFVGQFPGHDGRVIAIEPAIDRVAALDDMRDVIAIELVRGRA